jgi:hypothetical protein
MHPEILMAVSFIAIVFNLAVVSKAIGALQRRESYRFSGWDGGLLLKGVEIHAALALVVAVLVGVAAAILLVLWAKL